VFSADGPRDTTARLVLGALGCSFMDSAGGSCHPSVTQIQAATGLSRRAVFTGIKKAEREGWISIEREFTKQKGGHRNAYQAAIPPEKPQNIDSPTSAPRAPVTETLVHHVHQENAHWCTTCTTTSAPRAPDLDKRSSKKKILPTTRSVPRSEAEPEKVVIGESEPARLDDQTRAEIVQAWNDIAGSCGLLRSHPTDVQARTLLADVWKADPAVRSIDYWLDIFERVSRSPTLTGREPLASGRRMRVDLRWIVPQVYRIAEGVYDSRPDGGKPDGRITSHARGARAIEYWLAEQGIPRASDGASVAENVVELRPKVP